MLQYAAVFIFLVLAWIFKDSIAALAFFYLLYLWLTDRDLFNPKYEDESVSDRMRRALHAPEDRRLQAARSVSDSSSDDDLYPTAMAWHADHDELQPCATPELTSSTPRRYSQRSYRSTDSLRPEPRAVSDLHISTIGVAPLADLERPLLYESRHAPIRRHTQDNIQWPPASEDSLDSGLDPQSLRNLIDPTQTRQRHSFALPSVSNSESRIPVVERQVQSAKERSTRDPEGVDGIYHARRAVSTEDFDEDLIDYYDDGESDSGDEFFLATDFADPLPKSNHSQSVDYLDDIMEYSYPRSNNSRRCFSEYDIRGVGYSDFGDLQNDNSSAESFPPESSESETSLSDMPETVESQDFTEHAESYHESTSLLVNRSKSQPNIINNRYRRSESSSSSEARSRTSRARSESCLSLSGKRSLSSSMIAETISMDDIDNHDDFRGKMRGMLGLERLPSGCRNGHKDQDTSLNFRHPHQRTNELLHKRLKRVLSNVSADDLDDQDSYLSPKRAREKDPRRAKSMPLDVEKMFEHLEQMEDRIKSVEMLNHSRDSSAFQLYDQDSRSEDDERYIDSPSIVDYQLGLRDTPPDQSSSSEKVEAEHRSTDTEVEIRMVLADPVRQADCRRPSSVVHATPIMIGTPVPQPLTVYKKAPPVAPKPNTKVHSVRSQHPGVVPPPGSDAPVRSGSMSLERSGRSSAQTAEHEGALDNGNASKLRQIRATEKSTAAAADSPLIVKHFGKSSDESEEKPVGSQGNSKLRNPELPSSSSWMDRLKQDLEDDAEWFSDDEELELPKRSTRSSSSEDLRPPNLICSISEDQAVRTERVNSKMAESDDSSLGSDEMDMMVRQNLPYIHPKELQELNISPLASAPAQTMLDPPDAMKTSKITSDIADTVNPLNHQRIVDFATPHSSHSESRSWRKKLSERFETIDDQLPASSRHPVMRASALVRVGSPDQLETTFFRLVEDKVKTEQDGVVECVEPARDGQSEDENPLIQRSPDQPDGTCSVDTVSAKKTLQESVEIIGSEEPPEEWTNLDENVLPAPSDFTESDISTTEVEDSEDDVVIDSHKYTEAPLVNHPTSAIPSQVAENINEDPIGLISNHVKVKSDPVLKPSVAVGLSCNNPVGRSTSVKRVEPEKLQFSASKAEIVESSPSESDESEADSQTIQEPHKNDELIDRVEKLKLEMKHASEETGPVIQNGSEVRDSSERVQKRYQPGTTSRLSALLFKFQLENEPNYQMPPKNHLQKIGNETKKQFLSTTKNKDLFKSSEGPPTRSVEPYFMKSKRLTANSEVQALPVVEPNHSTIVGTVKVHSRPEVISHNPKRDSMSRRDFNKLEPPKQPSNQISRADKENCSTLLLTSVKAIDAEPETQRSQITLPPRGGVSEDVLNIWDTNLPVRDTKEKILTPARIHISHNLLSTATSRMPGSLHSLPKHQNETHEEPKEITVAIRPSRSIHKSIKPIHSIIPPEEKERSSTSPNKDQHWSPTSPREAEELSAAPQLPARLSSLPHFMNHSPKPFSKISPMIKVSPRADPSTSQAPRRPKVQEVNPNISTPNVDVNQDRVAPIHRRIITPVSVATSSASTASPASYQAVRLALSPETRRKPFKTSVERSRSLPRKVTLGDGSKSEVRSPWPQAVKYQNTHLPKHAPLESKQVSLGSDQRGFTLPHPSDLSPPRPMKSESVHQAAARSRQPKSSPQLQQDHSELAVGRNIKPHWASPAYSLPVETPPHSLPCNDFAPLDIPDLESYKEQTLRNFQEQESNYAILRKPDNRENLDHRSTTDYVENVDYRDSVDYRADIHDIRYSPSKYLRDLGYEDYPRQQQPDGSFNPNTATSSSGSHLVSSLASERYDSDDVFRNDDGLPRGSRYPRNLNYQPDPIAHDPVTSQYQTQYIPQYGCNPNVDQPLQATQASSANTGLAMSPDWLPNPVYSQPSHQNAYRIPHNSQPTHNQRQLHPQDTPPALPPRSYKEDNSPTNPYNSFTSLHWTNPSKPSTNYGHSNTQPFTPRPIKDDRRSGKPHRARSVPDIQDHTSPGNMSGNAPYYDSRSVNRPNVPYYRMRSAEREPRKYSNNTSTDFTPIKYATREYRHARPREHLNQFDNRTYIDDNRFVMADTNPASRHQYWYEDNNNHLVFSDC